MLVRICKLARTWTFWLGLLLYGLAAGFAIISLPLEDHGIKWFLMALAAVLYALNETFRFSELSRKELDEQIDQRLSCVQALQYLSPTQKLRSNIFREFRRERLYRIWRHHNMARHDDLTIEIPFNRGCTGKAWLEKRQIWAGREKFMTPAEDRVPEEQAKKVPPDLRWICSTPIRHKHKVLGVLNFDGNVDMNEEQQARIEEHAQRVAHELSNSLSKY